MKKIISCLLIFAFLFVNAFAASTIYSEYNKISGKIELETEGTIEVGSKFRVNIAVNFNDATPIERVTAFHLTGSVSDNIEISGFDFYDTEKKSSNISSVKMKDRTIDYTSIAFATDPFIEAGDDGYGMLIWIEFTALEAGEATITLDDSYIRSAVEDLPEHKRCLSLDEFKVTIDTAIGGSGSSSSGSSSSGSGSSSGSSSSGSGSRPSSSGGSSSGSTGGSIVIPTTPVVPEKEIVFADVENSHWGYEFVKDLFEKEIVSGAGNDENGNPIINPNNSITRQEAAKLAASSAEIRIPTDHMHTFADSADIADWAVPFVVRCCEAGVIKGYEDNTFKPNNNITREELVTIIVNAFGIELGDSADTAVFADADQITWSAPYVAAAVKAGITKGYDDNTFKPRAYITRIEAITMFSRAMTAFGK